MISRRLQAAGQKVVGTTAADAQSVQAAACACLAAAFGTKTAFASVASLLKQSSSQPAGGSLYVQQTLLELCLSGERQHAIRFELANQMLHWFSSWTTGQTCLAMDKSDSVRNV